MKKYRIESEKLNFDIFPRYIVVITYFKAYNNLNLHKKIFKINVKNIFPSISHQ